MAAQAGHTFNLEFLDRSKGASARVAVELTAGAAEALIGAIQRALAGAEVLSPNPGSARAPAG